MRKGLYTHAISILNQAFAEKSENKKKIEGQDTTDSSSSSSSINEDNFFSFENFLITGRSVWGFNNII
jgi:hypothetical protein